MIWVMKILFTESPRLLLLHYIPNVMVPGSLERKLTYHQCQLKSSYILWVTKIMPHFILLHNWTWISWHFLFTFLFCWLKTVFLLKHSSFSVTLPMALNTHSAQSPRPCTLIQKVRWTTVTLERDIFPAHCHSTVRHLGWGLLFSRTYFILFPGFHHFSGKLPQ